MVVAIVTLDKLMKGDAEYHSIVLTQRLEELQQAQTWAQTQVLVQNISTLYNQAKMCAKLHQQIRRTVHLTMNLVRIS